MKLMFLGEYGYAYRQLLPFLEKHWIHVDRLATWEPIKKVCGILWPRLDVVSIEDPEDGYRDENHYKKSFLEHELSLHGFIRPLDVGLPYFHDWNVQVECHALRRKIICGAQVRPKSGLLVFMRNRGLRPDKNYTVDNWVFDFLRTVRKGEPVATIGLSSESRFIGNVSHISNIYEQINAFNNCRSFLCPSSGLADMALACGAEEIILTGEYPNFDAVNHHGTRVRYADEFFGSSERA